MKNSKRALFIVLLISSLYCFSINSKREKSGDKPKIEKLGTIAIDLVEATPFVFKNEVYRLEWVRPNTKHNASEISYLHIVNHKTLLKQNTLGCFVYSLLIACCIYLA